MIPDYTNNIIYSFHNNPKTTQTRPPTSPASSNSQIVSLASSTTYSKKAIYHSCRQLNYLMISRWQMFRNMFC